jgi:signal transduction histidine kinase/ligand-binding sensor domain-containing protein
MHPMYTAPVRPAHLLRSLLGCALIVFAALQCHAQAGTFNLGSWSTSDGLPESQVQALANDGPDRLWVGTAGGICIFDGKQCSVPPYLGQSKFPVTNITVTYVAKDGTLWLGTEGAGLIHLSGKKMERFDRTSGLADVYVRAITQDSTDQIWVGTDGGLFTLHGQSFRRPPELALATHDVHALLADTKGRIIVGAGNSVSIVHGRVEQLRLPGTSNHLQVKSLATGRGTTVFLGTTEGVFEEDNGTYKRLPLPRVDTEALYQGLDGSLWAGTISNGLWRWKDGEALQISFGVGSAHQSVYAIDANGPGYLWLGTEDGLRRIQKSAISVIRSSALAVDRETLAIGRNGQVLLANSKLFDITHGAPRIIYLTLSPETRILNALSSRNGSLWVGTAGEGIIRISTLGQNVSYSSRTKPHIAADYPRGLVEDRNGSIWVATAFGLSRIDGRSVETFDSSNGLPNHNIRALSLTSDGCLWLGTDGGPAVFCHGAFIQNEATQQLKGEQIWSLAQGKNGVVWLGTTNHGLFAYTASGLRHITQKDGLLANSICSLVVDNEGSLWIAGTDNLSVVSTADIQSYMATPENTFFFAQNLSLPGGVEGLHFTSGRFPAALFDGRSHVWFSSDIGALRVDTQAVHADASSFRMPVPYLSSRQANDTSMQIRPDIRLPARTVRISVRLGLRTLSPHDDQLLAYRLKGIDTLWHVASEQHDVIYNSLLPGSYILELRATSRAHHQTWQSATYRILIPFVWYRSRWFLILLVVGLPSLILLVYLFHLRTIRYRFRLVLQERTRLAREMHDTLIQGCNGVAMLLEAESNGRGDPPAGLLDLARTQLHATVADAREAVWNLRNSEMAPETLASRLKAIATQTSNSLGIPIHVRCVIRLPELSTKIAHEILMITREAIMNAGKHSSATEIKLGIQSTATQLILTISDDGCGFIPQNTDSAKPQEHFGLLGMKERARSIGSEFTLHSTVDIGTTITLSVPLPRSGT